MSEENELMVLGRRILCSVGVWTHTIFLSPQHSQFSAPAGKEPGWNLPGPWQGMCLARVQGLLRNALSAMRFQVEMTDRSSGPVQCELGP